MDHLVPFQCVRKAPPCLSGSDVWYWLLRQTSSGGGEGNGSPPPCSNAQACVLPLREKCPGMRAASLSCERCWSDRRRSSKLKCLLHLNIFRLKQRVNREPLPHIIVSRPHRKEMWSLGSGPPATGTRGSRLPQAPSGQLCPGRHLRQASLQAAEFCPTLACLFHPS